MLLTSIAVANNPRKGRDERRRAVVIGKFDGVHLGHQMLLKQLADEAATRNLDSGVIAFHPDPMVVLQPDKSVQYLMTPADRVENLLDLGLDVVLTWEFTRELATLTAREFLELLHDRLQVSLVLMGPTHRMGCDRVSYEEAKRQAAELGVEVIGLSEATSYDSEAISSSAIRSDISEGRLKEASEKLSRHLLISGIADTRGNSSSLDGSSSIDFWHEEYLALPPDGDYVGWLEVGGTGYVTRAVLEAQRIVRMDAFDIEGDVINQKAAFYLMRGLLPDQWPG